VSGRRGASNTCPRPISARRAEPAWGPLNERFQCFSAFERAERGKGSPLGRSPLRRTVHAWPRTLVGEGRRSCAVVSARAVRRTRTFSLQSGGRETLVPWQMLFIRSVVASWLATSTRLREIIHVTCSAALTLSPRSCRAPSAANMSKNRPAWPRRE
jgi:hypothetical protein